MTSNLPVAGVAQALSGYVARAAVEQGLIEQGLARPGAAGIDSEFARVLVEVRGEGRAVDGGAYAGGTGVSGTGRSRAEIGAGADEPAARLARALAAEAPLPWLAAPLVHRAVDAYRELMNVAV